MKLLLQLILGIFCQFNSYAQYTSGVITFERETYQKIYNTMEEYGQIRIDTTTVRRYGNYEIIVIKYDTTKEVLTQIDSFQYYFNDSILCGIDVWENPYTNTDTSLWKINYADSTAMSFVVKNGICRLLRKNNLKELKEVPLQTENILEYRNDQKVISGLTGFKIKIFGNSCNKFYGSIVDGYVTDNIIFPQKELLECVMIYPYTPLDLIIESKHFKWNWQLKNFTPKKLDDPFEAMKRDYNFK